MSRLSRPCCVRQFGEVVAAGAGRFLVERREQVEQQLAQIVSPGLHR